MIKNILTNIAGVGHYGILSLCLFVFVFVCMLIWAFTLKKPHLKHMAGMPLEQEPNHPDYDNGHE